MRLISNKDNINGKEYICIPVPVKYNNVVKKLLLYVAAYGKPFIDDCKSLCTNKGRTVFEVWNMFLIAMEAYGLHREADCDLLMNTIDEKIGHMEKVTLEELPINIKITKEFICIYHKLLYYISELNSDDFIHCDNVCSCENKFIIKLIMVFYSALANYNIGLVKEAEFLIHYVLAELENKYKVSGKEIYKGKVRVKIDDNGYLVGFVSCGDTETVKFDVDSSTGKLIMIRKGINDYKLTDTDLSVKYKD